MRWFFYLLLYIPMQIFALVITPFLPAFAYPQLGLCDNANRSGIEPRLPTWLSWFDTPDNSLFGDDNWNKENDGGYWSQVAWLYRNSLYGFKWSVLAMPIESTRVMIGNPQIDYHTKVFGSMRIKQQNGAWQYKLVKPLFGRILVFNIGWLLDDVSQKRALFMLSPRWKKHK